MAAFVLVQLIFIPILGALYLGARLERERNERTYRAAVAALYRQSFAGRRY